MVKLSIDEVLPKFPDFRVALVLSEGLALAEQRTPALAEIVAGVEAEVTAGWGERPSGEIPEIKAWREAYKGFGVKKTSYRSSVERLIRSIQRGRGLPAVNSLVDAYNAASARHRMPVGADDLDKVAGDLAFRYARPEDSFVALGDETQSNDPPKSGEVVYADGEKVLCRRWNWYQDARSATTPQTRRAVITVQHLGAAEALLAATEELQSWIEAHCGGRCAWAIADATNPQATAGL